MTFPRSSPITLERLENITSTVIARAKQTGAEQVCGFKRSNNSLYRDEDTSEVAGNFWRESTDCVPFQVAAGTPYVVLIVTSPDSAEAAHVQADQANPTAYVGAQHSFFRLFTHFEDHPYAVCSWNCSYL